MKKQLTDIFKNNEDMLGALDTHFQKDKGVENLDKGEEVDGEWVWDKWDEIFPNGHEAGRMWDCSDPELKAFLDEKAEELSGMMKDTLILE